MSAMSVALMGVKGGPAIRPGSNMPTSILVRAGAKTILVDAGLGAARGLCDQGIALTALDLIVITHLHSDHYLELGPLMHTAWVAGLNRHIPIIGPKRLAHYWHHFCCAMQDDIALRIEDEGRCDFEPLADLHPIAPGIVYDAGGVDVSAMKNDHPPIEESYALKIESGAKSAVLSGDTAAMDAMIDFARHADLLVHECMLPEGVDALCAAMTNGDERLRAHILRSHTSARDAGRIARDAGVGQLALNHFVPDGDRSFPPSAYEAAARTHWSGPLHIGHDGLVIRL
jgi:ribonuclease BN (tRNA processing enzyme)